MATNPDIRVRLSADGLQEVVGALQKVRVESQKTSKEATAGFAGLSRSLGSVKGALAGLGIAVGIVETTRAITGLLRESSRLADELGDASEALGGTSQKTVALAAAARITETDTAKLSAALVTMSKNTAAFARGAGPAADALRQLGFSARDFRGKDLADQFALIASRISGITDGQAKLNAATEIFGKRIAFELIPMLNLLGRQGFEGVRRQVGELFSPTVLSRIDTMRQAFGLLDFQVKGLAAQFISGLAPGVTAGIESISRGLATNTNAWERWGRSIGIEVGKAIILIDDFVDIATTGFTRLGIRMQAIAAEVQAFVTGQAFIIAAINESAKRVSESVEKDYQKRRAQRAKEFDELRAGRLSEVAPTPTATAQESLAINARIAQLRSAADLELQIARAGLKAQQSDLERSLNESLVSLRAYYAERRRLQTETFDAEIAALNRRRAAELQEPDVDKRSIAVASIDAEIRAKQIELQSTLADIDADERQAIERSATQRRQVERELAELRGQNHRVAMAQIEDEVRKYSEILEKLRPLRQPLVGPEGPLGEADDAFQKAAEAAVSALTEIQEARAGLAEQVLAGAITQEDAERRLLEVQAARVPEARALADEAVRAADATGRQASRELADQLAIGASLEEARLARTAPEVFREAMSGAAAVLGEFDARRAEIQDRMNAGLVSQVRGEQQLLDLERERLEELQRLASVVQAIADASGNAELQRQAAALAEEVGRAESRVASLDRAAVRLSVAFEDASRTGLVEYLTEGIKEAGGFRDAILSVVSALQRLVAEALATRIVAGLFAGFTSVLGGGGGGGGGTLIENVGAGAARGGLITASGVSRRGYAGGGVVRGPGTATSDSISTAVPVGTFIVRAASVRRPGVLGRLRGMLERARGLSSIPGPLVPVRLSSGEFKVPPEVVRQPGHLAELDRINRGALPMVLRQAPGFATGGLVFSGAGGSVPETSGGSRIDGTITVALEDGLVPRQIETPAGQRAILQAIAKNRRAARQALGG